MLGAWWFFLEVLAEVLTKVLQKFLSHLCGPELPLSQEIGHCGFGTA